MHKHNLVYIINQIKGIKPFNFCGIIRLVKFITYWLQLKIILATPKGDNKYTIKIAVIQPEFYISEIAHDIIVRSSAFKLET